LKSRIVGNGRHCPNDFVDKSNPVRVIDVFVGGLDLAEMSFKGVGPARPVGPRSTPQVSSSFTFKAI
jgi:hypothetical protein